MLQGFAELAKVPPYKREVVSSISDAKKKKKEGTDTCYRRTLENRTAWKKPGTLGGTLYDPVHSNAQIGKPVGWKQTSWGREERERQAPAGALLSGVRAAFWS